MFNRVIASDKRPDVMSNRCSSYMSPLLYVVMWLILVGGSFTAHGEQSESVLSPEQLKELAAKIDAAEKRLHNIKIGSEVWVETKANLSDPCEPWQLTPVYVSSTAWFEGRPGVKARVDVHKEVLRTLQSKYPYSQKSYSMGFDGQCGRIVYHTMGQLGKTFPHREGRIFPECPNSLKWGWYGRFTGIDFTLNFFFEGKDYTFSDLFRWADDPNTTVPSCFKFTREVFQGVPCIKIGTKGTKWFHKIWWLDPSRGFALLGHKYVARLADGTERIRRFIKVSKLKEVAPGFWWPMEAYILSAPTESGPTYERFVYGASKLYERFVYRASNVVINDPNFDENIFTVPFPVGYLIDDQVAGRKYVVGQE